ncbi:hypothetical protein HPB50_002467 [Hyalomma asiaticum]|uniref:Uncharacterized protein n=1 Tax=Hyalomma asiaticum TaxID=266040 RepID=A0ACB7RJV0_HYAAI|nr:hypothetical protein HPB50_002467 [Hyalomma asiaticum]
MGRCHSHFAENACLLCRKLYKQTREVVWENISPKTTQRKPPKQRTPVLDATPVDQPNYSPPAATQENSFCDAPRKPRRGATSHEERLAIVAAVADNPRCSAQEIKVNFGLKASKSTVKRRLYQAGLKSRTAEQKVLLRTANKDKRLQFAQRHAGWIEQDWKKVIFTDESSFTTSWDQKTRIRRPDCTL